MTKEELLKIAEALQSQAYESKALFDLIEPCRGQYSSLIGTVCQEGCLLRIFKLYEGRGTFGIEKLLNICEQNSAFFCQNRKEDREFPYTLMPEEEKLAEFKDVVTVSRTLLCAIADVPLDKIPPVIHELPFKKIIKLLQSKYHELSDLIIVLKAHRDKMYVHNDKEGLLSPEKIADENELLSTALDYLIRFAIHVTSFVVMALRSPFPPPDFSRELNKGGVPHK